jgi:hypothetical protein
MKRKECQDMFFGLTEHADVCEMCRNFPLCMRDHLDRDGHNMISRIFGKLLCSISLRFFKNRLSDLPDFSKTPMSVHELYAPQRLDTWRGKAQFIILVSDEDASKWLERFGKRK